MNTKNKIEVLCAGVKKAPAAELNFEEVEAELKEMDSPLEIAIRQQWIAERDRYQGLLDNRSERKLELRARWIVLGKQKLATGASHE